MKTFRRYSELIRLHTVEDRFNYLKIAASVGESTFGFNRYLNQALYKSKEWRDFKREMVIRDKACDMALEGWDIPDGAILVLHHINPLTLEDVENRSDALFDPENVVCVSDRTHRAIHYGDISLINTLPIERRPNDTCPWKV